MSKVATYLQEHILGEVVTDPVILKALSQDASVLSITPQMVVYPRETNDIRKIARFSWQLAEKGHAIPLTVRGSGTDETGGAIGCGIIVSMVAHLNNVLEFDAKQKLIRVQPGVMMKSLGDMLSLHGLALPVVPASAAYSTVGGAVATNACGPLSARFGKMREWTAQLEVVLANGEVLQTERLSRRDLERKKGLQTFEGEIYRNLDNLIEDNKQFINDSIGTDSADTSGYSAIAQVKRRDGSFDLTPLLVGSQGTLGIVSEMILKADFVRTESAVVAIAFTSKEAARDALDQLRAFEPAFLDYYDGEYFELAAAKGKKYDFYRDIDGMVSAAVVLGFNDFHDRARRKKLKKVAKFLKSQDVVFEVADEDAGRLKDVTEVTSYLLLPDEKGVSAPPLFDGAYVPIERFEEFSNAVAALAAKHQVILPIHYRALDSTVYTRPQLQLHKVGDKQKVFKLLDEYAATVTSYNGCLVAQGGEGRVKARFAHAQLDDETKALYESVKQVFDPYNILNPGVKQPSDVRDLVSKLRGDYDTSARPDVLPYN